MHGRRVPTGQVDPRPDPPSARHVRALGDTVERMGPRGARPAVGHPSLHRLVLHRGRKNRTPGTFSTRVVTEGVTPSLHVQYKNTQIKQYHKEGRALRTETTINNTLDFDLRKGLTNLRDRARIGYAANRRLLRVQRLSHDPVIGVEALHAVCDPVRHDDGTHVAGLPFTDLRAQALLHNLLMFRLQPNGFTNRDLRGLLAEHLGRPPDAITAGQATYDLRRLRAHGLIAAGPIPTAP